MPNASIYNIGRGAPVKLMDFISTLGAAVGQKPILEMLPMQDGDVYTTWADTQGFNRNYDFKPEVGLSSGINKFIKWYLHFKI